MRREKGVLSIVLIQMKFRFSCVSSSQVSLPGREDYLVRFPDLRMYPESFPMKHYLLLGVRHAMEKWVQQRFDPVALKAGWHGWRAHVQTERIKFPSQSELNYYIDDDHLDASNPRTRHFAADWAAPESVNG